MQKFTDDLIDCERKSVAYPNLTEIYPNGTVSQAYMVQQMFINKLAKSRVLRNRLVAARLLDLPKKQ